MIYFSILILLLVILMGSESCGSDCLHESTDVTTNQMVQDELKSIKTLLRKLTDSNSATSSERNALSAFILEHNSLNNAQLSQKSSGDELDHFTPDNNVQYSNVEDEQIKKQDCLQKISDEFNQCNNSSYEKLKPFLTDLDDKSGQYLCYTCCGLWEQVECWIKAARFKCQENELTQVHRLPYDTQHNLDQVCENYTAQSCKSITIDSCHSNQTILAFNQLNSRNSSRQEIPGGSDDSIKWIPIEWIIIIVLSLISICMATLFAIYYRKSKANQTISSTPAPNECNNHLLEQNPLEMTDIAPIEPLVKIEAG